MFRRLFLSLRWQIIRSEFGKRTQEVQRNSKDYTKYDVTPERGS